MIRHVVLFTWSETTTDAEVAEITARLRALPGSIPELRSYYVGADLGIAGTADFAVVADFDNAADFAAYQSHPLHVAVRDEWILPRVAHRHAVQYTLAVAVPQ
ncbi:MAG: Dabb family protein [Acidimicrobiia bacterium]